MNYSLNTEWQKFNRERSRCRIFRVNHSISTMRRPYLCLNWRIQYSLDLYPKWQYMHSRPKSANGTDLAISADGNCAVWLGAKCAVLLVVVFNACLGQGWWGCNSRTHTHTHTHAHTHTHTAVTMGPLRWQSLSDSWDLYRPLHCSHFVWFLCFVTQWTTFFFPSPLMHSINCRKGKKGLSSTYLNHCGCQTSPGLLACWCASVSDFPEDCR